MAKQIDWRRARAPKPTEDKLGEGMMRKDGSITRILPKDSLATRAAAAELDWLKRTGLIEEKGKIFKKPRRFR